MYHVYYVQQQTCTVNNWNLYVQEPTTTLVDELDRVAMGPGRGGRVSIQGLQLS